MSYPNESVSLGVINAARAVFLVLSNPATGQVWNGTIWTTDSNANLILGAIQGTTDQRGWVTFAIPAGIQVTYAGEVYPRAGGSPNVTDISGSSQPLASGVGGVTSSVTVTPASQVIVIDQ